MFDKVVFAGGGHRCWWQAGFWEVLRAEIELRPRVIGATCFYFFLFFSFYKFSFIIFLYSCFFF